MAFSPWPIVPGLQGVVSKSSLMPGGFANNILMPRDEQFANHFRRSPNFPSAFATFGATTNWQYG